jgi:hypothetical protein
MVVMTTLPRRANASTHACAAFLGAEPRAVNASKTVLASRLAWISSIDAMTWRMRI